MYFTSEKARAFSVIQNISLHYLCTSTSLIPREPTYPYKDDSVFEIDPPVVSPASERIYEHSVRVAMGEITIPPSSLELYDSYASKASHQLGNS